MPLSCVQGLVRFTGKNYEDIRKDLTRDLYLTSVEAVDYGLIDKVVSIPIPYLFFHSFLFDTNVPSVSAHISRECFAFFHVQNLKWTRAVIPHLSQHEQAGCSDESISLNGQLLICIDADVYAGSSANGAHRR